MNRRGASERADGRTQTLKSARAIDAINGCVRLVAGKIDDEHRGAYPTSSSRRKPASRRATDAPHRAAPRRTARGEDGAKTEISIFRPLRGGSFDARICPVPRPVRAKRLSKHRRRARATPRSCTQSSSPSTFAVHPRCCFLYFGNYRRLKSRDSNRSSRVDPNIITSAPMFSGKSRQRRRRRLARER